MTDVKFGFHVSIKDGIDLAVDRAKELSCDCFQLFTRNPRGWKISKLDDGEITRFREKLSESGLGPPVTHMPYLPNLASPVKTIWKLSVKALQAELDRCRRLGIPYIVTHLGSHMGKGMEAGFRQLIGAINKSFDANPGETMVLLEIMAGQKNSMGSRFEDIRRILEGIHERSRAGVCFDTCHAYAAGYDLRSENGIKQTLKQFDEIVGFKNLKVIHINDSAGSIGSGKDRHEHLGKGYIGDKGFRIFLHQPEVRSVPMILETPFENPGDDLKNLAKVRRLAASHA
jgi:deoxyribonuclease-4